MLFLRALLFSLLGASALAIPFHHGISSSAVPAGGAADLTKQGPRQSDGLWYRTKLVSEHCSFYPTRYQISIAWPRRTLVWTKSDKNQLRIFRASVS